MAHSRFRPGIALRYKELQDLQKTITITTKLRDSIYLVQEDITAIGLLEFLVDMDIGICSCSRGSSGAACKHQAAVARDFNICTVNLPPFHSKIARQTFAVLAMGTTYTMDVDFYADLRNQGNSLKLDVMHTSTTNSSWNTSREPTTDDIDPNDSGPNLLDHIHNSSHPSEAQLSGYR